MFATNTFEQSILKLMKGVSIPGIETPYLALFMSDLDDSGQGYEADYSQYQRQPIRFSSPAEYGTGLAIQNIEQINFPECPVSSGAIVYVGVYDSPNGGDMLLYGKLDVPLSLYSGVTPIFREGSIKWIWTGNLGRDYRASIMNVFRNIPCPGFDAYIGLCNGDPEQGGNEFAGYSYERMRLRVSDPQETDNGVCICYNIEEITSEEASGDWGNMSYVCVYNSVSDGIPFAIIPLNTSYFVSAHTSVGFHIGSFRFSVN